ncbi:phorbol-12-myristate-13-acetate-induced protein 1-like [Choloepus didactylus]|uniref:phorbol-12-myristate-13-acetate-induced protein 1-like n=1 Tax=Choloepus didactylus TaxID=27675 RepID=UPI00189CD668|nr:phorbol-12-myristate-13-acetate-induced protein 1-like [Choloepus didactylus]
MTRKKARKNAQWSHVRTPAELEDECATQLKEKWRQTEFQATQLRRIGDKLNFRQKLLNLIAKLFCSGT